MIVEMPIFWAYWPKVIVLAAVDEPTKASICVVGSMMTSMPKKSSSVMVIAAGAAEKESVSEPLSPTSVDFAARKEETVVKV